MKIGCIGYGLAAKWLGALVAVGLILGLCVGCADDDDDDDDDSTGGGSTLNIVTRNNLPTAGSTVTVSHMGAEKSATIIAGGSVDDPFKGVTFSDNPASDRRFVFGTNGTMKDGSSDGSNGGAREYKYMLAKDTTDNVVCKIYLQMTKCSYGTTYNTDTNRLEYELLTPSELAAYFGSNKWETTIKNREAYYITNESYGNEAKRELLDDLNDYYDTDVYTTETDNTTLLDTYVQMERGALEYNKGYDSDRYSNMFNLVMAFDVGSLTKDGSDGHATGAYFTGSDLESDFLEKLCFAGEFRIGERPFLDLEIGYNYGVQVRDENDDLSVSQKCLVSYKATSDTVTLRNGHGSEMTISYVVGTGSDKDKVTFTYNGHTAVYTYHPYSWQLSEVAD